MFNFVTNNKKLIFVLTFFKEKTKKQFKFILKVYLKKILIQKMYTQILKYSK